MPLLLSKWYLDCQSESEFGYYYVVTLDIGRYSIYLAEVHHRWGDGQTDLSSGGFGVDRSLRHVSCGAADLRMVDNRIKFVYSDGNKAFQGSWNLSRGAPLGPVRPLYRTERGWCDWSIWSCCSDVKLTITDGQQRTISGKGYADYVRLAFPLWRIPFKSIVWGRLFSEADWVIFFRLEAPDGNTFWVDRRDRIYRTGGLQVESSREVGGKRFVWTLDSATWECIVTDVLYQGRILSSRRTSHLVPSRLLEWLGSHGYEEKYFVEAELDGIAYKGPMERVRWS